MKGKILLKRFMLATSVKKSSKLHFLKKFMKEFTQVKNHIPADFVARSLLKKAIKWLMR